MKVIVPTIDGLTFAPDLDKATSFRCMTIINGSIQADILKSVPGDSNENLSGKIKAFNGLINSDIPCSDDPINQKYIIATAFAKEEERELQKISFKLFTSPDKNITNALIIFLKNQVARESDYCCAP